MAKKLVRLTESDLHKIIKESVNKVLCEWECDERPKAMNIDGKYSFKNLEVIIRGSSWGTPKIEYSTPHEGNTAQGLWGSKFMEFFNNFYQETQDKEQSIYQTVLKLFKPRI
jgi:hypothetical protein